MKRADQKKTINKKNSRKPVIISLIAVSVIILIWLAYSLFSNWRNGLYIPEILDLSNQPETAGSFIHEMYEAAMDNPGSDQAIGRLGMTFHALSFYEEAERCYLRAMHLNEKQWRWPYYMALIHEEVGDIQNTTSHLKKVVEINPDVVQAWYRLGSAYLKQTDYNEAISAFEKVITQEPFEIKPMRNIRLLNKGAYPLKAYATFHIGRTEFEQGEYDKARRRMNDLLDTYPRFGSAYRLLGQIYFELGEKGKADDYFMRAADFIAYLPPADIIYDDLILYSRNPDILIKQLELAKRAQDYDWALELNRHIIECKPEQEALLRELLKFSIELKQTEVARIYVDVLIHLFQYKEDELLSMTRFLISHEQYELALLVIEQIRSANRGSVGAHLEYVSILLETNELQKGVDYCNRLIASWADNPFIRMTVTRLLIKQQKYDEAAEHLSRAENIIPDNPALLLLRARILRGQNNASHAIALYQRFLQANPGNIPYTMELGNYYIELRRWKTAFQFFEEELMRSLNNRDYIERYARLLAACPDPRYRNGQKAKPFAERLHLMPKHTEEFKYRSAMTVAVTFAELQDFDKALKIINDNLTELKTKNVEDYYNQFEALQKLFEAGKPYRI